MKVGNRIVSSAKRRPPMPPCVRRAFVIANASAGVGSSMDRMFQSACVPYSAKARWYRVTKSWSFSVLVSCIGSPNNHSTRLSASEKLREPTVAYRAESTGRLSRIEQFKAGDPQRMIIAASLALYANERPKFIPKKLVRTSPPPKMRPGTARRKAPHRTIVPSQ